nr:probable E3 ubiquitin-protein ligase LUL4 [Ipomoea trifida]
MGISFSTNTSRRSNIRSGYYGNPYAYPAPSPYPYPAPHPHLLPPPPPPPVNSYYGSTGYNGYPVLGRALLPPSCPYHCNDWGGVRLAPPPQGVPVPPPPPPPYRQSKKVKSGVNVHKDTAKLELDERNPDQHLVSFVFDALCDGR